jgi:hypothetical protein
MILPPSFLVLSLNNKIGFSMNVDKLPNNMKFYVCSTSEKATIRTPAVITMKHSSRDMIASDERNHCVDK